MNEMKLLDEARLLLCGLLFHIILTLAPKNHPEGMRIVMITKVWAKNETLLRAQKGMK